ncbi:contactin-associated protein-like 4 [Patella vulgata]|uniref:contactin-associated protein-like 4 n=1 Tax=Patella vulgata TaxID=6465 RepID=UPI00217F4431|nr:contactin-associated protein-like 4 [Patella vulgata]
MAHLVTLVLIMSMSVVWATNKMCANLDTFGYEVSRNTFRNGETILTVEESELVTCMRTCLQYSLCSFINFNTELGVCHLMTPKDNLMTQEGTPTTVQSLAVVSSMASSWTKDILRGPCFIHSCPNNTHCIVNDQELGKCEVIGCVGAPSVSYINQSAFQIKTMWHIDEVVMLPCLYESSGSANCTSGGSWSEFECQRVPPTDCSDAVDKNYTVGTTPIIIDVDGNGPLEQVEVSCDGKFTVIGHNTTNRTYINDYEQKYSYKLDLHYTVSLQHIKAIKQNADYCEQFLRYECFAALRSDAAWINMHHQRAFYFAGNGTDNDACACGIEDSCDAQGVKCNCQINDNVWREDSGFITNITALPMITFEGGDTGSTHERAYVTIGPLRCQRLDV